jgi:hypothetical protein
MNVHETRVGYRVCICTGESSCLPQLTAIDKTFNNKNNLCADAIIIGLHFYTYFVLNYTRFK